MLSRLKDNKSKGQQWLAELQCHPTKSERAYRLIVLREDALFQWSPRQPPMFELYEFRLVVTNLPPTYTASDVMDLSYDRCDQEKVISQMGDDVRMWHMPVREFACNEAWLEISRLA